jgi:hypothetical protein
MTMGNTDLHIAADGQSSIMEIKVEFLMSKVSTISEVLWLPPLHCLAQFYRVRTMAELQGALSSALLSGFSNSVKSTASSPNMTNTGTGLTTGRTGGSVVPSSSHTSLSTSTSQGSGKTDADSLMRMPVRFESLLHSAATLLPVPLPLQLRGRFTAVLNAQNKFESMTLQAEHF